MTVKRAIREYLRYLAVGKHLAQNSQSNYSRYLASLSCWCDLHKLEQIESVSYDDVLDWQESISKDHATLTQNYYLIALRGLLKFLISKDVPVLSPEKIILGKSREREVVYLEPEEVAQMCGVIPETTAGQLRDRAIIQALFSAGLRVGELASLKRNQVSLTRGEISVAGKGGKIRPVFLSEEALEAVRLYLTKRKDGNPFLFIHHRGNGEPSTLTKSLSPRSIQRKIRYWASLAGISKPVTPHKLRHSFATDLLRNGADLRSVQALLGHSSLATTQIYTHVTDKSLKDVHRRFHNSERKGVATDLENCEIDYSRKIEN